MSIVELMFWISFLAAAFAYVGYPATVVTVAAIAGRPWKKESRFPSLSLLIAAHNEEASIREKLQQSLELDYPRDKLEIVVVSDGSTDRTDAIVGEFADRGIRLIRTPARSGKTAAQNFAVPHTSGEIIVFSDATTIYRPDTLELLVRSFAERKVGGVEAMLLYVAGGSGHLGGKDLAKRYESRIKSAESLVWGGIGDNGACYAIRREIWRPLEATVTSDLAAPLDVMRQGYRFVFEPEAVSIENATESWKDEFKRKIRTVRAGVHTVLRSLDLVVPGSNNWTAYVLWGRKISRWLSAFLLPILFLSSAALAGRPSFLAFFALQCLGLTLAGVGMVHEKLGDRHRLISLARGFAAINLAAMIGTVLALFSSSTEVWTPDRGADDG